MDSKLARLKPSFSSLSYSERLDCIRTIRANRRISKRPPSSDKPKRLNTAKKAPTKREATKLLAALTPEMAAALLAQFGGEDENPA